MSGFKIEVNGELMHLDNPLLVDLVNQLDLLNKRVAISLNAAVVPKSSWKATNLKDGDKLEIITAIGGG